MKNLSNTETEQKNSVESRNGKAELAEFLKILTLIMYLFSMIIQLQTPFTCIFNHKMNFLGGIGHTPRMPPF